MSVITAVFSGALQPGMVGLAESFSSSGFDVSVLNSKEIGEALTGAGIKFIAGSVASFLTDSRKNEAIVVASLPDPSATTIDVGAHALIRASAAHFQTSTVVVDPASYPLIKERLQPGRLVLTLEDRAVLARRAFAATAAYDSKVARAVEASLDPVNVMVVGGGGREHALAWRLASSPRVKHVFCCPGNGGTASDDRLSNVAIAETDHDGLVAFAKAQGVGMVVVGPEKPLVEGLSGKCAAAGVPVFGPSAAAAEIEASKAYAKEFMQRYGLPTAAYKAFSHVAEAKAYVNSVGHSVVIKASGLAAGKGVLLPTSAAAACADLDSVMTGGAFGAAGDKVVVEELLSGEEVSVLAFCDGATAVCMPAAQDHKRALDGDGGENTGGMGAYAPAPALTPELKKETDRIMQAAVTAMAADGRPFVGVLYGGFMLTPGQTPSSPLVPKLLEFNCRFGDPETQVLLPLLQSDLLEVMQKCVAGTLQQQDVCWRPGASCATVVLASEGYPASYPKGRVITGAAAAAAAQPGVTVFHAGTQVRPASPTEAAALVTKGGRVLAVSSVAPSLRGALLQSYAAVDKLHFDGMHFRTDIGFRAVRPSSSSSSSSCPPLRLGVLGSTRGTDLQAILDAISSGGLNAEVSCVISNRAKAGILERARGAGVPASRVCALSAKGKGREQFDAEVTERLEAAGVELVLLVGYMRIVSAAFCRRWAHRMHNVHPSLLPEFAGGMDLEVHSAVIQAGKTESGCTVHEVTEIVDGGPIVSQRRCEVRSDDTPESLKARVQPLEGEAFIDGINAMLQGKIGPAPAAAAAAAAKTKASAAAASAAANAPPPTPAAAAAAAAPPAAAAAAAAAADGGLSYKAAGVDIDAGAELVRRIKPACKSTRRTGCDADLGGFGGLFDLEAAGYGPGTILVACTDGVGTKLKVAQLAKDHSGVGVDLVAMCVNDLIVQGAEPLFFLDYYATGKLEVSEAAAVVEGIAEGCRQSGCGLIGGETAEMPSMYGEGEYDLGGFSVGAVQRSAVLPQGIVSGDVLIALPSSGCHSNGFSLVRKLVSSLGLSYDSPCPFTLPPAAGAAAAAAAATTLGGGLLTPTRIYVKALMPLIRAGVLRGMAHITGGGLPENLPRVLSSGQRARINVGAWQLPAVFEWMMQQGNIKQSEMLRTFNCGVGMVLVVDPAKQEQVLSLLRAANEPCCVIGAVEDSTTDAAAAGLDAAAAAAVEAEGSGGQVLVYGELKA